MANENGKDKVVAMPEPKQAKIEARDLTVIQRERVVQLQNQIQILVQQRNQYLIGIADGCELDKTWQFDFDGFLNGQTCRFVRPVQEKTETK